MWGAIVDCRQLTPWGWVGVGEQGSRQVCFLLMAGSERQGTAGRSRTEEEKMLGAGEADLGEWARSPHSQACIFALGRAASGRGVGRPGTARQHKAGAQGPGRFCDRYLSRVWWELRGGWRARSQGTRRWCPSWVQGGTEAKQYVLQVALGQFWTYLATRARGPWSATTLTSTRTERKY